MSAPSHLTGKSNGLRLAYVFIIRNFHSCLTSSISDPFIDFIDYQNKEVFTRSLNSIGYQVQYVVPNDGIFCFNDLKSFLARFTLTVFDESIEEIMVVIHSHGSSQGIFFIRL